MQQILRATAIAALFSLSLTSCATNGTYSREDIGGVVGGILGGVVGYNMIGKGNGRWVGATIGAIALHLVGKSIGRHMDKLDEQRIVDANQRGLSSNSGTPHVEHWTNGNKTITTMVNSGDHFLATGRPCKNYTQETFVTIGARTEKATQNGIACWNEHTQSWDLFAKQ